MKLDRLGADGPRAVLDLADRDRHHPGAKASRIAQLRQAPHDTQHRLLHHVVNVGMSVQGSPDDVVNQRQMFAEQLRERFPIAGARRLDQR